jgi:hypothetical protein
MENEKSDSGSNAGLWLIIIGLYLIFTSIIQAITDNLIIVVFTKIIVAGAALFTIFWVAGLAVPDKQLVMISRPMLCFCGILYVGMLISAIAVGHRK